MKSHFSKYFVLPLGGLLIVVLLILSATTSWAGGGGDSACNSFPYTQVEKLKLPPEQKRQLGAALKKQVVSVRLEVYEASSCGFQEPYRISIANLNEDKSFSVKVEGLELDEYFIVLLAKADSNGYGRTLFYSTQLVNVRSTTEPARISPEFNIFPDQKVTIKMSGVPGDFSGNQGIIIVNHDGGSHWTDPNDVTEDSVSVDVYVRADQVLGDAVITDSTGETTTVLDLSGVSIVETVVAGRSIAQVAYNESATGGVVIENITFAYENIMPKKFVLDFSAAPMVYREGYPEWIYFLVGEKRYVVPYSHIDNTYGEKVIASWGRSVTEAKSVPGDELEMISLGANATMKPGTFYFKTTTDSTVWEVFEEGRIRSADIAALNESLGDGWQARLVVDIPDIFFTNYDIQRDVEVDEACEAYVQLSKESPLAGYVLRNTANNEFIRFSWVNTCSVGVNVQEFAMRSFGTASSRDVTDVTCGMMNKKSQESVSTKDGQNEVIFTGGYYLPAMSKQTMVCMSTVGEFAENSVESAFYLYRIKAVDDSGYGVFVDHKPLLSSDRVNGGELFVTSESMTIVDSILTPGFVQYESSSDGPSGRPSESEVVAEIDIYASGPEDGTFVGVMISVNHNRGEGGTPPEWTFVRSHIDVVGGRLETFLVDESATQVSFSNGVFGHSIEIDTGAFANFKIAADTSEFQEGDVLEIGIDRLTWELSDGTRVSQKYGDSLGTVVATY